MTERSESRNPAEDNLHCNYNEALCAAGIYGEVEGHPLTEVFTRRFEDLSSSSSSLLLAFTIATRRKGPFEWIEAPPAVLVPPEESPLVVSNMYHVEIFSSTRVKTVRCNSSVISVTATEGQFVVLGDDRGEAQKEKQKR
uniref:Uncharacterized protein n=1 Tax=Vespula pensylvanica TaxID=30213 RepID=A0A834PGH7_VESPE|nr:hypothetical protein H0235_001718 [Vespula pensylvanica]